MATVAVGISGGVDSSVTALLLKKAGHDVIGVHMRNWDASDEQGEEVCTETDDLKYARAVCEQLEIPLKQVDLVEPYWNNVFEPFLQAYSEGVTPNPDVWCNREIKFGRFHEYCIQRLGVDYVATGHYCQVQTTNAGSDVVAPRAQLLRGVDPIKDQSYFLCLVHPQAIAKAMFPIGHLHKAQVREIAETHGLATAKRPDSYGICFIGKRKLDTFLPGYIGVTKGAFVDHDTGEVLGHHQGAELYTIGQKARIAGLDRKWFVVRLNVTDGVVKVVDDTHHPAMYCDYIETPARDFNWIEPVDLVPGDSLLCRYRIRYRQDEMAHCTVTLSSCGERLRVKFGVAQRAATCGQAIALYAADTPPATGYGGSFETPDAYQAAKQHLVVLGGGIIDSIGPSYATQGLATPEPHERIN